MVSKNLDFNCALITGGGGGIGFAISQWLIDEGKKVIIAGRTESKLQDAANALGHSTTYYVLDTGSIDSIPQFVERLIQKQPEVDCLINNAGVQRPLSFDEFDLAKADQEIDINIRGPMHLAVNLLPHFKSKQAAAIWNVSSVLGYNPFSVINPVYNGTKAFLHFHTMNMRTQLKDTNIRVVEIVPPTVGTDLHRERSNPDDNKKENNSGALSVEEFMKEIKSDIKADKEIVSAGMGNGIVDTWYNTYGPTYEKMTSG
ncbi:MAG: hypothetical protein MMC23_006971 [Stictis urceolatum]|nr:hypothetical protein [Stictis urceolata]